MSFVVNLLSALIGLVLTLIAFFVSAFYLGTYEAHTELMRNHFWATIGLRLGAGLLVGVGGLACWGLVCLVLVKLGLMQQSKLGRNLVRLAIGPLLGAASGALIFCLA